MRLSGISKKGLRRIARSARKATMDDKAWDMYEKLREYLGDEGLLESLIRAMDTEEAIENFEFIWRMNDLDSMENEDDEDY